MKSQIAAMLAVFIVVLSATVSNATVISPKSWFPAIAQRWVHQRNKRNVVAVVKSLSFSRDGAGEGEEAQCDDPFSAVFQALGSFEGNLIAEFLSDEKFRCQMMAFADAPSNQG